jgi:lipoate synthase
LGGVGGSSQQEQQQQQPPEPWPNVQDINQLYEDALQLCRVLVAAAPLPLVCNNPSCENLARASETAVATKLCVGCRCRYCSAACQTADWRRHRRGCKAMTAAGLVASCCSAAVVVPLLNTQYVLVVLCTTGTYCT